MKITYLGQNGLLFETAGARVLIDPYLSDAAAVPFPDKKRRYPVDERFFDCKPNVIVVTHDHIDHYDRETLRRFLVKDAAITVLSAASVWPDVRRMAEGNEYVLFDRGTSYTAGGVLFTAVHAEHSDRAAIGVVLDDGRKSYYVTGDTLYSEKVFASLPDVRFAAVFLPVGGAGNNMNVADAVRFAARVKADRYVPVHVGLLDDKTCAGFAVEGTVIPTLYKEIVL